MRICKIPAQGGTDQFLTDGSVPVMGLNFQWMESGFTSTAKRQLGSLGMHKFIGCAKMVLKYNN